MPNKVVDRKGFVTYRTRKLPRDYLNRMRVLACLCDLELEEIVSLVIAKGLPLVEADQGVTCVAKENP